MNILNYDVVDSKILTDFEHMVCLFRENQCQDGTSLRLFDGIRKRMRESSLGSFLHHLNSVQLQDLDVQCDKLDRIRFDVEKELEVPDKFCRRNDICEDLLGFIGKLLQRSPSGIITVNDSLRRMAFLRLTGSKICTADNSLHMLPDLQGLVLAGNCLSDFPGAFLPRSLQLLELCYNSLHSLSLLLQDCPSNLLYLGLANNFLTQDVIQPLTKAKHLTHLDLAHNDVRELVVAMDACFQLDNLSSLFLVGNPCSMTVSYADYVLHRLPRLIFLDGKMLKKQNESPEDHFDFTGVLQITLYRIMNIPQPPSQKINKKKVKHTMRLEVYCPLLQSYIPKREEEFIENFTLLKENTGEKVSGSKGTNKKQKEIKNKTKNTTKTDKPSGKMLKPRKSEMAEVLENDPLNETTLKDKQHDTDLCFVSEQRGWEKIIKFSDPTIEISMGDLFSLRDVFRSNLTVRVVHLKMLPPSVKKKSKLNKQAKAKPGSQEDESSKRNSNKEILVSKTILADIKIPLQDILWTTKSLDYTWNIDKPSKTDLTPGLKELQYTVKKKKPSKKVKGRETEASTELSIPDSFTCHIGIGIKRVNTG